MKKLYKHGDFLLLPFDGMFGDYREVQMILSSLSNKKNKIECHLTSIIPKNCPWIYSEFGIIFIINPLTSEEYLKFYNNSINKLNNELQKLGGMIENVPKHINEKIQSKIDTIKNNIYWHNYLKFRFKV